MQNDTQTRSAGLALVGWTPKHQNTLRGFAVVRLSTGLTIHDVVVHAAHGRAWANLPSKPMIGADGVARRDDAGKIRYAPVLEWPDRTAADKFSAAVIDLIEAAHPGAVRS